MEGRVLNQAIFARRLLHVQRHGQSISVAFTVAPVLFSRTFV